MDIVQLFSDLFLLLFKPAAIISVSAKRNRSESLRVCLFFRYLEGLRVFSLTDWFSWRSFEEAGASKKVRGARKGKKIVFAASGAGEFASKEVVLNLNVQSGMKKSCDSVSLRCFYKSDPIKILEFE